MRSRAPLSSWSFPSPLLPTDEYKTDEEHELEVEQDPEEFIAAAPVTNCANIKSTLPLKPNGSSHPINPNAHSSDIFRQVIACFGTVSDQAGLKHIITHHGGIVNGYITKSVTHVVCGHDVESVDASLIKVQAAASKQVPVVTEKLFYDSLASRKLLSEKRYLVSSHPYLRRIIRKK